MMKGKLLPTYLISCLILVSPVSFADTPTQDPGDNTDAGNLANYLKVLGQYFGYDLSQYCTPGTNCGKSKGSSTISNALFNENTTYTTELNVYNTYLGALLGGTQQAISLVPDNTANYAMINTLAGQSYGAASYATPSTQTISVSNLVDQPTYQTNPVSQAILNILSTPNYTYCMDNNGKNLVANCPILYREKIMANVIGTLQGTQTYFSTTYNKDFLSQLSSDTLLSPLLYSTTNPDNNSTSSSPNTQKIPGLNAQTQAQQAANFVRYASGLVNPLNFPQRNIYDNLVNKAMNYSGNTTPSDQQDAQNKLYNYLTNLRVYAAQSSVGISNLYYILSKRLPQNPSAGNNPSSDALNEFIMATWRLYNPNSNSANQQWLTQINGGSAASVQKEIAILLAEINYQLYLSRQQQERLLLTNTMLLMQQSKSGTNPPDPSLLQSATQ